LNHFFDATKPDANTTMALHFEDNRASQMSLSQAVQFMQIGDETLAGRSGFMPATASRC
jgi:hypothetical protein